MSTVQPINFQAKHRFVTPAIQKNIQILSDKMNKESVINTCGEQFTAHEVKSLTSKEDDIKFTKEATKLLNSNSQNAIIAMNGINLAINENTGEIVKHHKPFFKSWSKIMTSLESLLSKLNDNYNNSDVVKKGYLSVHGLTSKGAKNLLNHTN